MSKHQPDQVHNEPPDKILSRAEYEPLLKKIEAYNHQPTLSEKQYEEYLCNYIDLLHLRDQGYPLLLRNGESHQLNAQPLSTHLLPQIDSKNDRWLLLTFLTENFELQVQIIQWTINDQGDDQAAQLKPLAEPETVCTEESLALNSRFYSLNFIETNGHCLITLTFQEGVLNVTTNTDEGIISTAWTKKISLSPVVERSSWGKMTEAIRIRRNQEVHWQNDSILDHENNELGKEPFEYGWIRGADSPEDNPNLVYMATNHANVICIDKTNPDVLAWDSKCLEGKALDALVVHIPELDGHAILASTDNGMVYLLIPKPGKDFKEKYVQLVGPRIERCIGSGKQHLLILNSRNILSPLLATNPERFWKQRDLATKKLIDHFFQNHNDLIHQSKDRNRLLLEYYLYGLGDHDDIDENVLKSFAQLCDILNNEITIAISKNNQEKLRKLADLQNDLIRRFFKWLKRSTTHQQLCQKLEKKTSTLDMVWKLVIPNHSLPDYVCLSLLRESAWLRRWAIKQEVIGKNKEFEKKLVAWEHDLQDLRKSFAAGLHSVRSLNTLNHYQLDSHCDHIELLDEHNGIIAVLEYSGNLRIFQINDSQCKLITLFDHPSTAQLSFIHALPEIGGGPSSKDNIHLITGSSQGELFLFNFNRKTEKLEVKKRHMCPAHLVCCLNIPGQKGVLLGGYNPHEKAVLYEWSYANILKNEQPPKLIWKDDQTPTNKGSLPDTEHSVCSIRQLRLSKNGKKLWAMNREKGYLYCWDISHDLFDKNRQLPEPQSILCTTRNLCALDYSSHHNLLVCGGIGGMAYAFDASIYSCYWTVICSGNLRRVVFLPDYPVSDKDRGAWMLCGDDQSSLIVDRNGNVVGIIRKAGSICSSVVYPKKQQVILGTLDGRLMLMDYSSSNQSNTLNSNLNLCDPLSYPVRNQSPVKTAELMSKILNIRSHDSYSNMVVLNKFSNYLQVSVVNTKLEILFLEYWNNQSLEHQIIFLYWLRSSCLNKNIKSDTNYKFILKMVDAAWDIFLNSLDVGLSCMLVSPLFDILNLLKENNIQAQDKLTKITDTVWKNQSTNSATDSNSALAAIRWNQSAKCWKKASNINGKVDIKMLFNWCNLIARESNAYNTNELDHSLSLLANLHLYNPSRDHAPSQWLLQFLRPELPTKSTNLAFKYLETSIAEPLSTHQLKELNELLPDNQIWISWLHELQGILSLLATSQSNKPHVAWQEQESWEMLREHISSTGKHRFSVPQGQAMLALWWPRIVEQWEYFIEESRQQLDQSVRDNTNDYLKIIYTDRWENSNCVALDLVLSNRFPEELRLEQISIKSQKELNDNIKQYKTQLPIPLPASENNTSISISIETMLADKINCVLQLKCSLAGSNQPVLINYQVEKERNLLRLSEDTSWKPTWDRLSNLLTEWDNDQKPFYWIDGHIWSANDRNNLWEDLLTKYPPHPQTALRNIPMDRLLSGIQDPVYSPDLALGAMPETLLEELHNLLKPIANDQMNYWALAIWREGKTLPEQVDKALDNKLPSQHAVLALLDNLLGKNNRIKVLECIKHLPQSALGAWCAEEPFYTPKDKTVDSTDIYPASSSLLPITFWQAVDQANVPDIELARLLAITPEQARTEQRSRQQFYQVIDQLFNNTENQKPNTQLCEPVIRQIFSRLGASGINAETTMWWSPATITLNWQDYTICYLLPKCSANARGQMRELSDNKHRLENRLWLCFGEASPPEDLPGMVIVLNPDETLALMHVNNPQEAARLLNQIAARIHGVSPDATFRSASGLGSGIDKHFGGRKQELKTLWACLDEADKKGAGSIILGGRRIGKTTLRERIRFEINIQQPKRVCLEFNFEGSGEDSRRVGIALEFWFFKRMQEEFADTDYPFDDKWHNSFDNNMGKRNQARILLRKHLDDLKKRTGYVPLFIFDETENLVRWDTASVQEPWSLFALFRKLIHEGKLCLFVTSYPHGMNSPHSLNIANLSSDNPIYNTFAFKIELKAWSPDTTWVYLSSRLAGLGVVLPLHYRDEMLAISRGIPWIVHAIGIHICKQLPRGEKVVYPQTWDLVKTRVLKEIHENLKVSVTKVANDLDLKTGSLDTNHQLGNGQLWRAFKTLASQPLGPVSPNTNHWSEPMQFSRGQLEELLPEVDSFVLREALRRLSSSPVMEGIASSEDQFVFSNNLLPSWMQLTQS